MFRKKLKQLSSSRNYRKINSSKNINWNNQICKNINSDKIITKNISVSRDIFLVLTEKGIEK